MRGPRGRIGVVTPTYLDSAEDWFQIVPDGVNVVFATLGVEEHTPNEFDKARATVERAARALGVEEHTPNEFDKARATVERAARGLIKMGVGAVLLGGSPLVTLQDDKGAADLAPELEKATGVPVTTGQDAAETALNALGVKKLLLVTPYKETLNAGMQRRLAARGFEVLALKTARGEAADRKSTRLNSS